MKGTMKLLSVLMIAIMLISVIPVQAFADPGVPAETTPATTGTKLSDQAKALETEVGKQSGDTTEIKTMVAKIIKWIRNVAVIAGVLILTVLGFKYMLGSAEEKADYKKSLIPLVVGIVVVMGASQIMAMIFSFLE